MVKLLAYLEKIQAATSTSDDRGRRGGVDSINLDFIASQTSGSTRAMVQFVFCWQTPLTLSQSFCRDSRPLRMVPLQMAVKLVF